MRQYLIRCLVISIAGAFLLVGCATTQRAELQRSMYVDSHPELSEILAEAILNGQIMVGMTEEMVQTAWGKPARVEPTDAEDAVIQWIYGNYFVGGTITNLYFGEDGKLVRYEVNNQPTHANSGSVNDPTKDKDIRATLNGNDALISKGSGNP